MSGQPIRWSRRADVSWRRSLDAVVVQAAAAEAPVVLQGTAVPVWELLAEPVTVDELVGTLVEVYGGDRAVIADDVDALLERMCGLGVVGEV